MSYFNPSRFIWLPRALALVYIIFLSLFALDAFQGEAPLLEKLFGFVIHLTPNFILIIILALSWRNPVISGVLFIILSVVFTLAFNTYRQPVTFITLSLPLAVTGILFIIARFLPEKSERQ